MIEKDLRCALGKDLDGNFERLVKGCQGRLYSFALRLTNHSHEAEDIVQEAFVRAYRALKTYPSGRIEAMNVKPWLYRILLNIFRNRLRRGQLRTISLEKIHSHLDKVRGNGRAIDPESLFGDSEIQNHLKIALALLPEKYRTPMVLRYVEGFGYSKMREILKQPEGTIRSNVSRGIRLLRERWIQRSKEERR
jgi:RNA polymerase sigma-70 factor (ECF subfamily)